MTYRFFGNVGYVAVETVEGAWDASLWPELSALRSLRLTDCFHGVKTKAKGLAR